MDIHWSCKFQICLHQLGFWRNKQRKLSEQTFPNRLCLCRDIKKRNFRSDLLKNLWLFASKSCLKPTTIAKITFKWSGLKNHYNDSVKYQYYDFSQDFFSSNAFLRSLKVLISERYILVLTCLVYHSWFRNLIQKYKKFYWTSVRKHSATRS